MTKLLGNALPEPESLEAMRKSPYNLPDTRWAVYQNHDGGHPELGHLKFMAVGPQNTFKQAPAIMPDTERAINWRYVHVGWVDLNDGRIIEA